MKSHEIVERGETSVLERGETSVNDILALKRYWRGVKSYEIVERGETSVLLTTDCL